MIQATALKNGKTFLMDGKPFQVVKYSHHKIARSGGTIKLRLRNLENGQLEQKTLTASNKVDEISTLKKSLQYLYSDDDNAVFMDETYNQIEAPLKVLGDQIKYINQGDKVNVLFWDDKPLSVDTPPKATLTIAQTTPGIKGNSASNMLKAATLDNGVNIKVPLFIKKGDKVRVDTRTGEYVERIS